MNKNVDREEVSFNIQAKALEVQHNSWAHQLITTTEGTKAIKQRQTIIIIIIAEESKLQGDRSTNKEYQDRRFPWHRIMVGTSEPTQPSLKNQCQCKASS